MEFNGWDPAVSSDIMRLEGDDIRVFRDTANLVNLRVPISELDVYSQFQFDFEEAKEVSDLFRPIVEDSVWELHSVHCLSSLSLVLT